MHTIVITGWPVARFSVPMHAGPFRWEYELMTTQKAAYTRTPKRVDVITEIRVRDANMCECVCVCIPFQPITRTCYNPRRSVRIF